MFAQWADLNTYPHIIGHNSQATFITFELDLDLIILTKFVWSLIDYYARHSIMMYYLLW